MSFQLKMIEAVKHLAQGRNTLAVLISQLDPEDETSKDAETVLQSVIDEIDAAGRILAQKLGWKDKRKIIVPKHFRGNGGN